MPGAATIVVRDAGPAGTDVAAIDAGVAVAAGGAGLHPAGDVFQPALPALPALSRQPAQRQPDDISALVFGDPVVAALFGAGVVMVGMASLLRRRHRHRIGWGVLPARPANGRDAIADWD